MRNQEHTPHPDPPKPAPVVPRADPTITQADGITALVRRAVNAEDMDLLPAHLFRAGHDE